MVNVGWVYSGLIVETFFNIIFISWFSIFIYRYRQLLKFKTKGGKLWTNNKVYLTLIILFAISLGMYLISLIFGIIFAVDESNDDLGYVFSVFLLVYFIVLFAFLTILLIYQNSIILVFKNETFVTLNGIVNAQSILQIRRDNKRNWIFINWKDEKNPKRIREMKLRYSFGVKDYLKSIGLWQEQEPIK